MLVWLCGIVLALAILLGGGTHAGFIGDIFVQLVSVPLLALSLWSFFNFQQINEQKRRVIFLFFIGIIVIFAVQLLSLPFQFPAIGGTLTARPSDLGGLGQEGSWFSISGTPQATWAAAASLVVPAAVFFAGLQLSLRHRLLVTWLLLSLGGLSLLLGFAQITQGPASALRFYTVTNRNEAVGLFANRNHFAALLYVTLVLAAAWYMTTIRQTLKTGALASRSILWSAAAAVFLVAVAAGVAIAHSRAGMFLAMVALAGIILMVLRQRKDREHEPIRSLTAGRMSIMAVLFAIFFAAQFGVGSILSRFEGNQLEDLRIPFAMATFEAGFRSLPFGTGLGSFVPVYATVEKDKDVGIGYANRAHNDFAEIFLETGVLGLILLVTFLVWFFPRAYEVWGQRKFNGHDPQVLLQRASAIIIFCLLAHSLVDYPLRTTALSSIFAFFCAVLVTEASDSKEEAIPQKQRRFADRTPPSRVTPGEKWGSELQWPEGWQKRG